MVRDKALTSGEVAVVKALASVEPNIYKIARIIKKSKKSVSNAMCQKNLVRRSSCQFINVELLFVEQDAAIKALLNYVRCTR